MPPSDFMETLSLLTGSREGKLWDCRLHFLGKGTQTSVEFDWINVINREEKHGDVIGFYHTHPIGLTRPSQRDVKTMRAWCDCLGKPLLCVIGIHKSHTTEMYGYLFRNYRSFGKKLTLKGQKAGQLLLKE